MKTIVWGILGCGNVTEKKSGPAYQKTAGFEIGAVMRRDAVKAADYAKRHGIAKYFTDADALINDPGIDAVYIATPPDTHCFYALKVARAGKICCIEKPMAVSYGECREIVSAFEERGLPLFIAYYRRSLPRFKKVKEWIDSGLIGEIRQVRWNLSKPPTENDLSGKYNWRTDPKIALGGYFEDLASHGMDLFTFFFGEINEVYGVSWNQQKLYESRDAIAACWRHESGITGSGNWNFGCATREDVVEIYGNKGKILFSVFDEKEIELITETGKTSLFIENPENVQLHHVQNMSEHLNGNLQHPSTGKSAAHTNWILERIISV